MKFVIAFDILPSMIAKDIPYIYTYRKYICTYMAPKLSNWFEMACCLFHFLRQSLYLCVYLIFCTYIHIYIFTHVSLNTTVSWQLINLFSIFYFANFLFLFDQDTRRLIRNIENIEKKLLPTSCCIQRNMFG